MMDTNAAHRRLVAVVRTLAAEKRPELERLKEEASGLVRPDFIWHYLLQSFSTMGRAAGWHGLIGNQNNYNRVTYSALASLTPTARKLQIQQVCRASGIRMPDKKADYIIGCFNHVQLLGGPDAAKARLLAERGREAKIRFLQTFPGIGPKYARNIMMDVYHEDFRDSIAIDVRILAISKSLGLSFASYAEHEQFYLSVAQEARINGWELDRLLFNFRSVIEAQLGIAVATSDRGTSPSVAISEIGRLAKRRDERGSERGSQPPTPTSKLKKWKFRAMDPNCHFYKKLMRKLISKVAILSAEDIPTEWDDFREAHVKACGMCREHADKHRTLFGNKPYYKDRNFFLRPPYTFRSPT